MFLILSQRLSLGSETRPVSRLYFGTLLSRLDSELPLEYQIEVGANYVWSWGCVSRRCITSFCFLKANRFHVVQSFQIPLNRPIILLVNTSLICCLPGWICSNLKRSLLFHSVMQVLSCLVMCLEKDQDCFTKWESSYLATLQQSGYDKFHNKLRILGWVFSLGFQSCRILQDSIKSMFASLLVLTDL